MGHLLLMVVPSLLSGLLLGWRWPALPSWLAPPMVRWGVPLSLAALLLRASWSPTLLRVGLLGLLVPLLTLVVLSALPPLRDRLRDPALILGASVGNTGYWGLPVALALLPPEAVATAAIYDVVGTLVTWSVGPLVLMGPRRSPASHLSGLLGNPLMQGFLLATLIRWTPWRNALALLLWWPARTVFVMALGLLGMRLGLALKSRSFAFSPGLPLAMLCKLLMVPALVWGLTRALALPVVDQQALVLQGAAPTALSVLLMAEAHQSSGPLASSLVVTSTIAAMVTVPLWWGVLH